MGDKSNSISDAAKDIMCKNSISVEHLNASFVGYLDGRWSSDRVKRELNIDSGEFWYLKSYAGGPFGCSPAPHYFTNEMISRQDAKETEVANWALRGGSEPENQRWTITAWAALAGLALSLAVTLIEPYIMTKSLR